MTGPAGVYARIIAAHYASAALQGVARYAASQLRHRAYMAQQHQRFHVTPATWCPACIAISGMTAPQQTEENR